MKQTIKWFKFSLWKIIVLAAHGVNGLAYCQEFDNIFAILRKIIVVIYATFAVAKRKPEKNSGLYGIRTLDLKMSNHGSKIISK